MANLQELHAPFRSSRNENSAPRANRDQYAR
jgi:hypothetical protein